MRNRRWQVTGLLLGGAMLLILSTNSAYAQWGGTSIGALFGGPNAAGWMGDGYRSPTKYSRATRDVGGEDQYSPRVWSARRGLAPRRTRTASYAATRSAVIFDDEVPTHSEPAPEAIPEPAEVPLVDGLGDVTYELSEEDGGDCQSCGLDGQCGPGVVCVPFPRPYDLQIFAGVHGFKGPLDEGLTGNFGFQEGLNISGPINIFPHLGIGYQVGWQAVQSNLSGTAGSPDARDQYFTTAGIFRHCQMGLQWGVVWDWMRNESSDRIDLNQIRAEISLVNIYGREIGARIATGTNDDTSDAGASEWEATDQFTFYHRWNLENGGNARLWGGATGSQDGLFGGDAVMPFSDTWALAVNGNYLIPNESSGSVGSQEEAWNLGINLVWHWKCRARASHCDLYRPMFDVADNGSFFVDRK